jgi:hypothetical protein
MKTEWKITESQGERYTVFLRVGEEEEHQERGGWMTWKMI